jgi:hypothetical protein
MANRTYLQRAGSRPGEVFEATQHSPGLGVTIHVGEEGGEYGIPEIRVVVSTLRPDRIGARDPKPSSAALRRSSIR